jgi:Flp pilus assembly protein CpaB
LALGGDLGLVKNSSEAKADKKVSSVVTLEASPRQAEEIVLASKLGDLSLSLRATEGKDAVSEPTSTFARDLMQKDSQSVAANPGKERSSDAPVKIRGLYGDQQKTITIE